MNNHRKNHINQTLIKTLYILYQQYLHISTF